MSIGAQLRCRWNEPCGYKTIVRVGVPLMASMGSTTVMEFTDRWFLSHYSLDAIAAALPAALAANALMITFMGLCGYTTVFIAQYTGAQELRQVGVALWQGIWAALVAGIGLALLWWIADPLFRLIDHGDAVRKLEIVYFRILLYGSVFFLLTTALGTFFSGRGQTRIVLCANVCAAIVNIPLDYLFIFGGLGIPSFGIVGAGWATVLGWVTSSIVLCVCIFTPAHQAMYGVCSQWRLNMHMFVRLIRYGLPNGGNLFIESFAFTWFVFEVGRLSPVVLAASNIAFSINSLTFVPLVGLSLAASSLVGNAMGQGKPLDAERYTQYTIHIAFLYVLPFFLLFCFAPDILMGFFVTPEVAGADYRAIIEMGRIFLAYIAVYTLADAFGLIYFGSLKGAGDTMGVLYIILCCSILCLVVPLCLLKYFAITNVHAYWMSVTSYIIGVAIVAAWRYRQRGWHHFKVIS